MIFWGRQNIAGESSLKNTMAAKLLTASFNARYGRIIGTTLEASEGMLVSCVVPPETTLMIRGCGSLYVLGIFHTVCFTFSTHT